MGLCNSCCKRAPTPPLRGICDRNTCCSGPSPPARIRSFSDETVSEIESEIYEDASDELDNILRKVSAWRGVACRGVPCLGVAWHGVARRSVPCVHARARLRLARPPDGRTHARRSAQAHERTRARASTCITHTCISAQEVGEESGEVEAVMPMPQRPLRSCRCRAGLFGRPNAASAPLVMPMRTPYRAQRCMQHNERGKARNGSGGHGPASDVRSWQLRMDPRTFGHRLRPHIRCHH